MQACTRYHFASTDDIAPPEEHEFAAQIVEIEKDLKSIREAQAVIGGMIYSYSAPEMSVFATHKQWRDELQQTSSTLEKCSLTISNLYSALPFSLEIVHKYMAHIHSIKLEIELSTEKISRLMLLLSSDAYAGSIVSYRRTIRQCQEICTAQKTDKNDLIKIWDKTAKEVAFQSKDLQNLDPRLSHHIQIVHNEITQFYDAARGKEICIQDCTLDDIIDKQFSTLSLTIPQAVLFRNTIKNIITERKEEAKSITLKNELTLCPSQYINISTITKYVNSATTALVSELEEEAKQLQLIQSTCLNTLQMLYHGKWTAFPSEEYPVEQLKMPLEAALILNRCTIIKIRKSLYTLIHTGEIERSLHYAARLLAANDETYYMTNYFFSNINRKNQLVIGAVNHTFKLLSEVVANKSSSKQLKALLFAARSTSQALLKYRKNNQHISQFNFQVASCLEMLIARIGNQILEKQTSDDQWCTIVKTGCNKDNCRNVFEYIEKSIIKWLYFSNTPSNIKLDIVLYACRKSDDYLSLLETRLKKHPTRAPLYQSYKSSYKESTISNLYVILKNKFASLELDNGAIDKLIKEEENSDQIIQLLENLNLREAPCKLLNAIFLQTEQI